MPLAATDRFEPSIHRFYPNFRCGIVKGPLFYRLPSWKTGIIGEPVPFFEKAVPGRWMFGIQIFKVSLEYHWRVPLKAGLL